MTSATFEEFLVQLDCQIGTKNIRILPSLTNVLHTQEIPLLCKILKLYFPPQIAQTVCKYWVWGLSMLSNASTESNSFRSQHNDQWRITW